QQSMIDGKYTCGYRDYAESFGEIIYLSNQSISKNWEKSMSDPKQVINYINSQDDCVIWSVKHNENKDKKILKHIKKHRKLYYSCCAGDTHNNYCDVSLVDCPSRLGGNA